MDIREIYKQFTVAMTHIELYQRTALKTSQQELLAIDSQEVSCATSQRKRIFPFSAHNTYFLHAKSGEDCVLGGTIVTLEHRILDVTIRRNKQYLWLLAEAYEHLEDLFEYVYAFCGHKNPENWPLGDFGSITLSQLHELDYDWHLGRAKQKKGAPHSLLQQLRNTFPELGATERKNKLKVDLKFMMIFIEELRHSIVHRGGVVQDLEIFRSKVFKTAGISPKSETAEKNQQFINQFFRIEGTAYIINLVEPKVFVGMPYYAGGGNFGKLFNYLASYGNLLCETVGLPEDATQRC